MELQKCYSYEEIEKCAKFIRNIIGDVKLDLAIICGSGLGGFADSLLESIKIPYSQIPNFPISTVSGHSGNLVLGYIKKHPVLCMQGRFHCYEGYAPQRYTLPIRVFKLLGINKLIVTNAAGAINEKYKNGDLMIIEDHLNLPGFAGCSPLVGQNDERFGVRFLPIHNPYSFKLIQKFEQTVQSLKKTEKTDLQIHRGVYCFVIGPCFETRAELRAIQRLGADCVGMSTVPEVITAVHCGIEVLGISLVTNSCADSELCHEEVLAMGKKSAGFLEKIISNFVTTLYQEKVVLNSEKILNQLIKVN